MLKGILNSLTLINPNGGSCFKLEPSSASVPILALEIHVSVFTFEHAKFKHSGLLSGEPCWQLMVTSCDITNVTNLALFGQFSLRSDENGGLIVLYYM